MPLSKHIMLPLKHIYIYIYIKLLIKRFNETTTKECDNVIKHVNKLTITAKDSIVLGNLILHNMQVSTILHKLFKSWKSIVVALKYHEIQVNMKNLSTLLGIEA